MDFMGMINGLLASTAGATGASEPSGPNTPVWGYMNPQPPGTDFAGLLGNLGSSLGSTFTTGLNSLGTQMAALTQPSITYNYEIGGNTYNQQLAQQAAAQQAAYAPATAAALYAPTAAQTPTAPPENPNPQMPTPAPAQPFVPYQGHTAVINNQPVMVSPTGVPFYQPPIVAGQNTVPNYNITTPQSGNKTSSGGFTYTPISNGGYGLG